MKNFNTVRDIYHDSSYLYLISTSPDGNYRYINNAYQKRFAHIYPDLTGKPYYVTMHPDDVKNIEMAAENCFKNPELTAPATIRKKNNDGSYIVTEWEFKIMFEDDGTFAGFFCLGYDITEFENEKHKTLLLNNTLKHAQNALNHKNNMLNELVFDQSHLLRSPLSNILGIVNIVRNMPMNQELRTLFDMMEQSSKNLDTVVRKIVNKAYE